MKSFADLSDEEWLRLVRSAAALPDAPEPLVRAAIDLWHGDLPRSPARSAAALHRLLVAALSFDSWAVPAAATAMRALPSDVRHLLYSAEERDIDLRITPSAGRYALAGQVLGLDVAGRVELAPSGAEPQVTEVDALGEFRFDDVPRGIYRLTLRVGHDEISLPPIDVGAQRGTGAS